MRSRRDNRRPLPYAPPASGWRLLDPYARPRWQAYTFAVIATLAMLALRLSADFHIGDPPMTIAFVIPIVLSAIFGGFGPGLAATLVAAIGVPYFLLDPQYSLSIAKAANRVSWLLLIAIGVVTSALIEALHRSRGRLEATERLSAVTLASIADAVVTTDVDGRVAFLNAEAERMTGWASPEAAGRPLHEVLRVVRADSREPLDDPVPQILRASAPVALAQDVLLVARDGREVAIDDSGASIRDGGGTPLGVVIVFRDCSARRRAEDDARRAQQELAESESRFRSYVQNAPIAMFVARSDGRIIDCNRAAVDLLGYDELSLRGKLTIELVAPDDRDAAMRAFEALLERGRVAGEFRALARDGRILWASIRGVRLADGNLMAFCTDITARREAEAALRESETRFRRLTTAAPGVVHAFALSPSGKATFRYASPRIVDIYGIDAATLAGDASAALGRIHRDDAARIHESIRESAGKMTAWRQEFRVLHPDRGEIWVEGHSAPMRDPDGTIVWHGILHDITERKRMEEALRMSRSQLLAALEAGGMGAWTWDVANDRFTWDESVLHVLGLPAGETSPTTLDGLLDLIHPADRDRVRASVDAVVRDGTHASGEFRITQPDGSIRWIEYTARVERDATARARRVIGIAIDITNRKRAEEAQLRSQKLESLGTLAGGIAHDFNNILVAITGNTRLAKSDLPRGHPAQESLDEIARAGARAVDLVRRILTFSRPYDHKREVMALAPVVDEALKLVRATLPSTVEIRTHYGDDVPPVSIDPTQIHQIIVNLATNAAHAIGPHGGHIDVRIDAADVGPDFASHTPGLREGRYVRLEVADDGCGMESATLDRIFDPFFTTKPQGLGTGLGLSVVHGIVKSHEGAVSVYSEPGRGTSLRIYIPAVETSPQRASARPEPRANGAHVLFVDDESALVMLVSRMLERLGYRVTGHSDATKALAELRAQPKRFDALVTDLAMNGMSGFELAREALAIRPALPVVMTSGLVRDEDRRTAEEIGVRALILKPDTIEALGDVLDRLLREHAEANGGAAVRVADPLHDS